MDRVREGGRERRGGDRDRDRDRDRNRDHHNSQYDSASRPTASGTNDTCKELVSYDDVPVAKQKAAFIQQRGLGGAMWWESSADKAGNDSLIRNVVAVLGGVDGSGLKSSLNQLLYPNSTYDNIRAGMPGSASSAAISSATDSSPSGSAAPTQFTTSTVRTTSVSTIISCASTVKNCPSHSTILTTLTIDLSTTICPVTETSASSTFSQIFSEASQATQASTVISFDTVSPSPTEISSISTKTTIISKQNTQSSIRSTLTIPGEDGVPGCAYILAGDLGAGALCSSDYCNCGGTVAPLLTSSISGTLTTNCHYQTQPATNSCPSPSSSSTSQTTTLLESVPTQTVIITVPGSTSPLVTVTSVVIVSKRNGVFWESTSLETSDTIIATSDSSVFILSSPPSAVSSSSISFTNSPSLPTISSPSPLGSSSLTPSSSATSSSVAASTSSSNCVISGHCNTYKLLACPGGDCFCGQDINNEPTCFEDQYCHYLRACSKDTDCATGEACGVKDCCGNGAGRYLRRATGCMDSPAADTPYWLPYFVKI